MFIAALLMVAMTGKQPKCPSMDYWKKKTCYVNTMEYYSAVRKDKILLFATKWMDTENIMLSKICQKTEVKNHYFTHI